MNLIQLIAMAAVQWISPPSGDLGGFLINANELRIENPTCPKADKIDKICDFFDQVKNGIVQAGSFNSLDAVQEQAMRDIKLTGGAIATNATNALRLFKNENVSKFAEPIITGSSARIIAPNTVPEPSELAAIYNLNNYPNPFNENTVIEVTIPENTKGKLLITDVVGKQLMEIELTQQENKLEINGNKLGYGVFFYSLYINKRFMITKKMTRMR
jgi:type IX secretion system substrate protein